LWTSLGLVLLLVITAGTLLVVRPAPVRALLGEPAATPSPTASPPPPEPVLGDLTGTDLPTAAGLASAVDALAADPRVGQLSASIVDVMSGESLYDRDGEAPKVPASVTKLVTAAAVLATRGPGHRMATRAVKGTQPGEVVLVGAGDPTLAVDGGDTYRGAARLDKLAEQVKQALGSTPPTRVLVDSSVFTGAALGPGWDSDIAVYGYGAPITGLMVNGGRVRPKQQAPRSRQPDLAAGQAFAKLLGVPPNAVTVGQAAQGAAELGAVRSLSVLRLVEIMLRDSDNVVAESLARQVALARNAEASFEGAAQATREVLDELRLPTGQVQLSDGSGLSRNNRLTTALLAGLLTLAAGDDRPALSGLFAGLPVAGYSGTLHDRFAGEADTAVGLVRAKTGTLNGVSALAGVVPDADGRLLSFSLIANRVPGGAYAAQVVLDRIAAALAGCGCR
jgi:D-alanyl-D-alanine carboxypeptidase/D-alanyl-D-alanine-endopeptidase (penicillin-binding protein 4)